MAHANLSVFDYAGKKICDLYDSDIRQNGQASNIAISTELSGWREMSFDLPYLIDGENNWRWKYIRNEYRVRVIEDEKEDWFIITAPKKQKSSGRISGSVTCGHLSGVLKTKNLYLAFDETNGIGTLPYLMNQILAGTGWSFDEEGSDIFYESHAVDDTDEKVEKKRSLSSDGKVGAYGLIGQVCDLFNAYPVYDAVNKTVACHDLNNKKPLWELEIGKTLTALTKEPNSDSTVTRLYVEGDYDENEYVGIDDVNPTGLPYLLNFDYYKEIGVFTESHQRALDEYITNISAIRKATTENATALNEKASMLSLLWGNVSYVLWTVKDGALDERFIGGDVEEAQQQFAIGDSMYVFTSDGRYTVETVTVDTRFVFENNVTHALKFIGKCNGSIGAKEVSIEAKEQTIAELEEENKKETTSDATRERNNETIRATRASIQEVYFGTGEAETHDYTIKVQGEHDLNDGDTIDATIARNSTSLTLNTAAYRLASTGAPFTTDATVENTAGAKLRIGDYGITDAMARHTTPSAISGTMRDLPSSILNISSVERSIPLTCEGGSVTLYGMTMTMTVSAIAYGLYEQFAMAVSIATDVGRMQKLQDDQIVQQANIEADFVIAMGDMLRDGYWNNDNYIKGQEKFLYYDALDVMKEVSKPSVKYTVTLLSFAKSIGYIPSAAEINSQGRIYDPELEINDIVYVKKIVRYIDRKDQGSVEITNEDVKITASFDSIFSRITSIANLIEQKQNIFKRAEAIKKDGSLATERLNGAIDILTTRLSSAVSNWYTDERGNIIFEASDGKSAMQLCGAGWMIANGKKKDGSWNWRTAATGEGLVADAIVTGYLSAARIEAGTITAEKLSSDVGKSLDLSSNESVRITVKNVVDSTVVYQMRISAEQGLFISSLTPQIELVARIYASGDDVTNEFDKSEFTWLRTSDNPDADKVWNDNHAGMKRVTLTASDIDSSAIFECRIDIQVDENLSRLYFDRVSVSNLKEDEFSMCLSCNAPHTQVHDPNSGGGYTPDWSVTPVEIIPYMTLYGAYATPETNSRLEVVWKRIVDGVESGLTENESVDGSGKLTVFQNVLGILSANSIEYVCTVYYNRKQVGQETFGFTPLRFETKTKSCVISGGNIFKYDHGVVNPNTQTLTCTVMNVDITEWQYKNASGNFVKIPGSGTGNSLVVRATDEIGIFNGDRCTVKVVTSDSSIYDIFTLYKVSNGASSASSKSYYAYIRYSAYEDGREMTTSRGNDTKYIGVYAGISSGVPPYTAFKWSRFVGSGNTVDNVKVEYNQVSGDHSGKPSDDDAGWTGTMPTLIDGYFLWVRTTVMFSDKTVMKTYNVSYNGASGSSSVKYYTYIRYSSYSDGRNMTRLPDSDSSYMGIYTGTSENAPTAYSAYTWTKLQGEESSGISVSEVTTTYAVTSDNARPAEDSSAWQTSVPSVSQGKYLWSKTVTRYSDNTSVTSFNVSYAGTDGDNTAIAYLTNECLSIAAKSDGSVPYTRMVTTVCACTGITHVTPVVNVSGIKNIPDGMTITSGRETDDGGIQLILQVTDGAYLGSGGLVSGTISIPVSVSKDGVVLLSTTLSLSWSKVYQGEAGTATADRVIYEVYTPDGNTFLDGKKTLRAAVLAYKGETSLTGSSTATLTWQKFVGGAWTNLSSTGSSISISNMDVATSGLYRCLMSYQGGTYQSTQTLIDHTDNYQAKIISSGGDTFINGGTSSLSCMVYRDGEPVEYRDSMYAWSKLDRFNNVTTFSATGKTITISASDITEMATYICQVDGMMTRIVMRSKNDIYISNTAPENPRADMLWLDTSGSISVMKRWIAEKVDANTGEVIDAHWEECTVTQSTLLDLQNFKKTTTTELNTLKDAVEARVTTEEYNATKKALETKIGEMALTDEKFRVTFSNTVESGINNQISNVAGDLSSYKAYVSNYMQYGADGVLTLGSSTSDFKTKITNQKVAFTQGEAEVAYISNSSMFITYARVTEQLSIGKDNGNGYFDWTVTPTGLGLKWRD